jgi:2-oxoglutarate ferredoxin oxidoreductase subunit gamma
MEKKTIRMLIAGFGGQGVLFIGKFLSYIGMLGNRQVSWLPSYGPEMRGGTANCSVILSDTAIGSPIVSDPDVLIAMNLPSFQKYQDKVQKGGVIVMDSSLIDEKPTRGDVGVYAVPATKMAADAGIKGFGNMIMLGRFLGACMPEAEPNIETALNHVVPPKRKHLLDDNRKALALGRSYTG